MKTTLRSLSYPLLYAVALAVLLGAATPDSPPNSGKFLVLRSGGTMEGDIERVGDQYRVRRNGGETFVPVATAVRLFRDTEDAYKFLRSRTNLNDADDRLRLAKWCLDHNLRPQAEEEASVALVLRPKDREAQQLLERIRQAPVAVAPQPAPPPPALPETTAPVVELTPEAMGQFTHKVQPILLNACVSCHAGDYRGSFKMTRVPDEPTLRRRATQENLVAVLAQINYVQPQASPLLTKAIGIHGGIDQAPLRGRQAVPYRTLEEWLRTTLANNPQLHERAGIAVVQPPPVAPEPKTVFAEAKADTPCTTEPPRPNIVPITPLPPPVTPLHPVAGLPVQTPEGDDEVCGSAEFNRQAHPERATSPTPKP